MSWMNVEASDQHYQAAIGKRGTLIAVLETWLCYLLGRLDVVVLTEHPYDLLERFVIRCLLELTPPPTIKQIATLLGFEDERFVASVLYRLRDQKYLYDTDTGSWHATLRLQKDFTDNRWIEEEPQKTVDFRYEWVTHTFLPEGMRPETWRRARTLPIEKEVKIDEDQIERWLPGLFEAKSNSTIRWERRNIEKEERWISPLQVIVYKAEQVEWEWEIFHPFMVLRREQHQLLRSIVRELGVETACQGLLKSG